MDETNMTGLQKAYSLIKAGNLADARAILVPMVKENPNVADAWYLLGFAVSEDSKKLYAFQQVLRIEPSHPGALKQLARLQPAPPPQPAPWEQTSPASTPFQSSFTQEPPLAQSPAPATSSSSFYSRLSQAAPPPPAPAASFQPYFAQDTSDSAAQKSAVPAFSLYPQSSEKAASKPAAAGAPHSKPARKLRTNLIWLGVAAITLLALFGGAAFYIWSGTNISDQANAAFARRDCGAVVTYSSFDANYPRPLFYSIYSVYNQLDECHAFLSVGEAVKKQDWPTAYGVAQKYLQFHSGGTFAAEMRQHFNDSLLAWSKKLLADKDYATAIEKLNILQAADPGSPAAATALDTEFEDYILWARALNEKKDFTNAENTLTKVRTDSKASAARVQEASQALAVVYLQWGMSQVDSGDFDKGLKHIEAARQLDPTLADYDRLSDQANLRIADALAAKGKFDEALQKAEDVVAKAKSDNSKAEAVSAEAKIVNVYAYSSSAQAKAQITTAATNICSNQKAPVLPALPLFALDTQSVRFTLVSPYELQVPDEILATSPAQLHYVVCNVVSQTTVQSCPYQGGYIVRRLRVYFTLSMFDIKTGKRVHTTKLAGGTPRNCLYTDYFGSQVKDVFGSMPTIEQVVNWLKTQKLN